MFFNKIFNFYWKNSPVFWDAFPIPFPIGQFIVQYFKEQGLQHNCILLQWRGHRRSNCPEVSKESYEKRGYPMKTLSIDIGGTALKAGLVSESAQIQEFREVPTFAGEGADAVMERVVRLAREFSGYDLLGISTAGQINPRTGEVILYTDSIPGYTGSNLKTYFEAALGVPAAVDNDANCMAMGEYAYGAAKGHPDFLSLVYGTGIGGALVQNGKIYYGSRYSAGEFGHMVTHFGGRVCKCGKQGCYEAYASASALTRLAEEKTGQALSGREIMKRLDDPVVDGLFSQWIDEVACGLASLIHIFDPPLVVLGGGILSPPQTIQRIKNRLPHFLRESYQGVPLCQAALGNQAGMLGAAHLAMNLSNSL